MSRPAESTPIPAHARAYTLLRSAPKPEPAGSCSVSRPQVRRRCIQLQAPAAGHPYSPQTADGRARLDALIARTGVAASPPRGQRSGAPYLHVRVPDEAGGGGLPKSPSPQTPSPHSPFTLVEAEGDEPKPHGSPSSLAPGASCPSVSAH